MGESDLVKLCTKYPDRIFDVPSASKLLGTSERSIQRVLSNLFSREDKTVNIKKLSTGYIFWSCDDGKSRQTTRSQED